MIGPEFREEAPAVDRRMLRQFAGLWLVIFGVLSGLNVAGGHPGRASALGVLALSVGSLGLIAPETIRPLFMTLTVVLKPFGLLMTRLLLAVLFYGLFTPIGLCFRALGRDQLTRKHQPNRPTYWVSRKRATDIRNYLRQS